MFGTLVGGNNVMILSNHCFKCLSQKPSIKKYSPRYFEEKQLQNKQSSLTDSDEEFSYTDGDKLIKKKYSKEGKWRNSKQEEPRGRNRRTHQVKNVNYKLSI